MRLVSALAVLLLLSLAGCLGSSRANPGQSVPSCPSMARPDQEAGAPPPVPLPMREGFEATGDGTVPAGWSRIDGGWGAAALAGAPDGRRALRGQGDADPGFSILLATPAGGLANLTAEVSFRMDCVEHPHGVGLVLHYAGPRDYQIVRYSATESAWDLFTVKGGVRVREANASVLPGTDPGGDAWTTLRVTSQDGRVEAFDGGVQVVAFDLPAGHSRSGQVGLFLRGSGSAWFDAVRVDALGLPASRPA